MTIPCDTCERRSECTRDRRCNRPRTPEFAEREWEAAVRAFHAATVRLNEATKLVLMSRGLKP